MNYAVEAEFEYLLRRLNEWIYASVSPVCGVAVMFRSALARWGLVVLAGLTIILPVLSAAPSGDMHCSIIFIFVVPVVILVMAFLPPVNRALRKTPQVAMRYGQPVPQQMGYPPQQPPQSMQQPMPQQPPQQPQPGYEYPPQQYPPAAVAAGTAPVTPVQALASALVEWSVSMGQSRRRHRSAGPPLACHRTGCAGRTS